MEKMTKLTGVSLFTGAGGMDVGFSNAGFSVLLANEISPYACETYSANHSETTLLRGDIKIYYDEIKNHHGVDIVFGGPPCQGFSVAGKMDPEDARSQLIWNFLDVVEMLQPRAFVMENVKALAVLDKWRNVRRRYMQRVADMGYSCNYFLLNSADFGVSQKRERVFFIGSKTPYDKEDLISSLRSKQAQPLTIRQLLSRIPQYGTQLNPQTCTARITLAANPVMRKSPYAGMIFNGMGRPLKLDSIAATLPASMGGNKTPIIDQRLLDNPNEEDWVKTYHAALLAKEISAEFKQAPNFLRRLTILEAAAIQSFPTDYGFCGTKSAIYTQIGNAVPCLLAECVAKSVIEVCFEQQHSHEIEKDKQLRLF